MVTTTKIAHNLMAMNSNRQLNITCDSLEQNMQKLSSGYKINKSADDAAGLAISEKMRKQIRGLDQSSENAQEGISLLQTAEGALNEVQDMLHRMNELAVQSSNGTNSETDRQYIQDEISQLKAEIDRVSHTTKYNEIYLLDGHLGDPSKAGLVEKEYVKYMEMADRKSGDEKRIEIANSALDFSRFVVTAINGDNLGSDVSMLDMMGLDGMKLLYTEGEVWYDVITNQTPAGTDTGYNTAEGNSLKNVLKNSIVPHAVASILDSFPNTFGYLNGSSIGIGLKLEDDASSNTLASVGIQYSYYATSPITPDYLGFTLTVNVASLKDTVSGKIADLTDTANSSIRNNLEVTTVHEMMHALMDETLTNGMIGYNPPETSVDSTKYRFPKWFIEGMAQTACGGCYNGNDWINGTLGLDKTSTVNEISNEVKKPANRLSVSDTSSDGEPSYGTGYLACMYLAYLSAGEPANVNVTNLRSGADSLLKSIKDGKSLEQVVKDTGYYNSLSDFESQFGDTKSAEFIRKLLVAVGDTGTGGLAAGFSAENGILPDTERNDILLFALNTDKTQVKNVYPNGYDVFAGGNRGNNTNNAGGGGNAGPIGGTGGGTARPVTGEIIDSEGLRLQIGTESEDDNKLTIYIEGMSSKQIGISEVDVTTELNANRSIDMIAFALNQVSSQRSRLGAYQNRLEHTIKNLDNVQENTQKSESAIRDTDMAKEMVSFSNNQILKQAGESMLAQTNQSNRGVLTLLG